MLSQSGHIGQQQSHTHQIVSTRPKPVEHGNVFSMAVVTIVEWLKLVPFFCEETYS